MVSRNLGILVGLLIIGYTGYTSADTKVGIGTGINTGFSRGYSGTISIPIKTGLSFMLEPFFGVTKTNEDVDQSLPNYREYNRDYYQLGIGLYGISQLVKGFEIYYGGTLGASKSETTTNYRSARGDNLNI